MSAGFATVLIVYSPPMAFVGGTLIAVGFGLANPSLSALISRNAPDEHQGAAMGASQSAQSMCRILGPISAGAAFGAVYALAESGFWNWIGFFCWYAFCFAVNTPNSTRRLWIKPNSAP